MSSQTKWITSDLFHSFIHCQKLSWLSFQNNIFIQSHYTHFFTHEIQFIIKHLTKKDPNTKYIDPNLPIQLRYNQTLLALNDQHKIVNGCLCWQQFTCKLDMLFFVNNQWQLSYIHPGFRLQKKDYISIAFVMHLLSKHDITISKINVMVINEHYRRLSSLDINKLLISSEIIQKVRPLIPTVAEKMNFLASQLNQNTAPKIPFNLPCIKPTTCQFLSTCFPYLSSNSIIKLSGISKQKKVTLIQNKISSIHDIALHMTLNPQQSIQVSCLLDNQPFYDVKLIESFLTQLQFPLYFMDFEVAQFIVPPFKGLKPLHQLPFQYSIHCLDHIESDAIHLDYLHQFTDNPEPYFAKKLCQDIPANVSIIVFNSHLESSILRSLQSQFPEYAAKLHRINQQLVDLSILFTNNAYYHPKMNGRYSLKDIYTAMLPNNKMQFKFLEIQNGESANIAYKEFLYETDAQKRNNTINQLTHYCQLDTYSMVAIIKHLFQIIN